MRFLMEYLWMLLSVLIERKRLVRTQNSFYLKKKNHHFLMYI